MATFAAHVIVHGESGPVQFAPGDEVPEWADGLVGDHVLTEPQSEEPAVEESTDATGGEDLEPVDAAPDFTGAKPQTRTRRK